MKKIKIRSRRTRVIKKLSQLRRAVADFRQVQRKARGSQQTIALVPTMGALHDGHLSLIRRAQSRADRVIVSIFVNPTQFAPNEDFRSYPRTFAADLAALRALHVDLVWAPPVETMYPQGFATRIMPEGPALAGLEDAFRPHFFAGVATVVAKLLTQCEPDVAIFGDKDYQQLKVITRLARDLDLRTRILGAPILREADGLARSSRNVYLSPSERQTAPTLYRVLKECAVGHRDRQADGGDIGGRACGDHKGRLCARLPRSAPRRDAGAGGLTQGRAGPAPGRGKDRQDEADR